MEVDVITIGNVIAVVLQRRAEVLLCCGRVLKFGPCFRNAASLKGDSDLAARTPCHSGSYFSK